MKVKYSWKIRWSKVIKTFVHHYSVTLSEMSSNISADGVSKLLVRINLAALFVVLP